MKERLSKIISRLGFSSRRKAERLVFEKRVMVNGSVALEPQMRCDSLKDEITVDGRKLEDLKNRYFVLHKPRGYICSSIGSKTVLSLFSDVKERLFTIGRLDKETSGLIIVTSDGPFAHRIMHPSFQVEKEYLVKVQEEVEDAHLKMISAGTEVQNCFIKPKRVVKVRRGTLKITLLDGKKHEVRELMANAKLNIMELCRIRIGNLRLNDLPLGMYRELTPREIDFFKSYS